MKRDVIAQGEVTMVERCGCGALYLTIGPICMKLDATVLPELRAMLGQASRALAGCEGPSSSSVADAGAEN